MRLVSAGSVVRSRVEANFFFHIQKSNSNNNVAVMDVDYTNAI